jgi:transposase, IS30 family
MSYKRVTAEERSQIYRWCQEGKSRRQIADLLDRAPSTISRELRRNRGGKGYRPKQAHEMALERARRPGARRFTEEVRSHAEAKLREGWTPEIICQRAKLDGLPHVCKETIYKHIYTDSKKGGDLWKHLPRAHRKRKRRCPRNDGRGRGLIPGRRGIETRPAEVEQRVAVGHWEGDLVVGSNGSGYLVTLVERVTRFACVGWVESKDADVVACAIIGLLEDVLEACKGITFDNGKEFARHAMIASELGVDVFFANPYHSWERGTNENTNGLIRRLLPKGASFSGLGTEGIKRLDRFVNDRPRKCLEWKTPREMLKDYLATVG